MAACQATRKQFVAKTPSGSKADPRFADIHVANSIPMYVRSPVAKQRKNLKEAEVCYGTGVKTDEARTVTHTFDNTAHKGSISGPSGSQSTTNKKQIFWTTTNK